MIFNIVDINVIRGVVTVDHLYVRHFTVVDWFQTKPIKLKVIKLTLVVVANLACLWENCTFNNENLIYKSQANLPIQLIHCVFDWFLFFKWYVQHFLLKLSSRYFFSLLSLIPTVLLENFIRQFTLSIKSRYPFTYKEWRSMNGESYDLLRSSSFKHSDQHIGLMQH